MLIDVPKYLDQNRILEFLIELEASIAEPDILLDFTDMKYSLPLYMLIVGRQIRYFVRWSGLSRQKTCLYKVDSYSTHNPQRRQSWGELP
jgi:hypothetical protein